jgi:hypothetical protein
MCPLSWYRSGRIARRERMLIIVPCARRGRCNKCPRHYLVLFPRNYCDGLDIDLADVCLYVPTRYPLPASWQRTSLFAEELVRISGWLLSTNRLWAELLYPVLVTVDT